ncbi:MAG: 3-hydroxybutyryl-CoA epimerase, partial [Desulfurococcales archaeon]|nr:3-hydroxybutyryl-CoA epimerase [Desulfurococcales archaeon]
MSQKEQADAFMKQVEEFANMMKQSIGLPVLVDQKSGAALWYDQRELKLRFIMSIERIKKFFDA